MRFDRLLMTLAAVCLLAAPAFSMPWGDGCMGRGACAALGNMTQEEMDNMTLAELKALKQENTQAPDGHHMFMGAACTLLADGITKAQLEEMTLAQIEAKWQELSDRMDNMTLGEIKALQEQKRADMQNMTLSQIQEQKEICHILNMVGNLDERGMGHKRGLGMPDHDMPGMGQGYGMGMPGQCMQGMGDGQAGRTCPRAGQ